jgi:hypothetical protein
VAASSDGDRHREPRWSIVHTRDRSRPMSAAAAERCETARLLPMQVRAAGICLRWNRIDVRPNYPHLQVEQLFGRRRHRGRRNAPLHMIEEPAHRITPNNNPVRSLKRFRRCGLTPICSLRLGRSGGSVSHCDDNRGGRPPSHFSVPFTNSCSRFAVHGKPHAVPNIQA